MCDVKRPELSHTHSHTNSIPKKQGFKTKKKKSLSTMIRDSEMLFVQPFCDNFYDTILSHIHIIFLFYLSFTLIFMSMHTFICKSMIVS